MQRIWGVVTDGLKAVPYAPVTIYVAGSQTLATLFDPNGGQTPSLAIPNPFAADGLGRWICAVPDGEYTVTWKPADGPSFTVPYWTVSGGGGIAVLVGATSSTDGVSGAAPAPLAGEEAYFLRGDASWAPVVIPVVADMTGATSGADGTHGLAPKPVAGDQTKYLRGDATWASVPAATGIRSTVTYTTASLSAGASENGDITVPKAYSILNATVDYPSRVRLYLTSAQRTSDASRAVTVDPTGNHGCILETVHVTGTLDLDLSPVAIGASPTDGTTVYLALENTDTVSRAITVTLDLLSMEA